MTNEAMREMIFFQWIQTHALWISMISKMAATTDLPFKFPWIKFISGERNERIRKDLKVAIKKKDRDLLNKAVSEFKKAKLADTEGDLAKAEHLLRRFKAKESKLSFFFM